MYSFATPQIETEREGERGLDKHVLTPFYGGLYLRADPLGLCRLPLACPGRRSYTTAQAETLLS